MQLGIQMSSLTPYQQTVEGMRATFARVAEMGCRAVQLQGIPLEVPDSEIARALRENGLDCIATQEDYPMGFGAQPERYIARAVACGSRYLTCALVPFDVDTVDKLRAFGESMGKIGEQVAKAGLVFAYHPIGPDFRLMDGVPVYKRLMEMLPREIQLTFCVYASFGSGVDYRQVLKEYAGRVDLAHLKDSQPRQEGKEQLMPLGEGAHDWAPILQACQEAGVQWAFAEQERWDRDAFDCVSSSLRYLQGIWPKG